MRRAQLLASVVSVFVIACSDENRANPIPSQPVDTGFPIVEAGSNDTGGNDTGAADAGDAGEDATADSGPPPTDSTVSETSTDTGSPMEDATFSDIVSTKDTAMDAILLEVGGSDTSPDTALPDALSFFDAAVEDADADTR